MTNPEIVLPNCVDCDAEAILKINDEMASEGLRNVAIAIKLLDEIPANPKAEDVERDLRFVGILGLKEPLREEIYKDIKTCNEAQIKVVMLSRFKSSPFFRCNDIRCNYTNLIFHLCSIFY